MSWLFSQALVEEYSAATSLDGGQFAQLNVMPTQHKFWHNGKTMDVSNLSRFGLTFQVLTDDYGAAVLMWCQEGSRAKTSQAQAKAQGSPETAQDFGRRWPESSEKWSQLSLLSKTAPYSSSEVLLSSYMTLPKWGSMRDGVVSEQAPLVPRTGASEFGSSLPTPSGCRSGKNHVAGRLDEWGGSSNRWRGTPTGKLHCPPFEEWVMGWPVQWTELTQSATDKFRQWRQTHGGF